MWNSECKLKRETPRVSVRFSTQDFLGGGIKRDRARIVFFDHQTHTPYFTPYTRTRQSTHHSPQKTDTRYTALRPARPDSEATRDRGIILLDSPI